MREEELPMRVWFYAQQSAPRAARRRGLHAEDANDLAVDGFLRIVRALEGKAESFQDDGDLEKYVARAILNGAGGVKRRRSHQSQLEPDEAERIRDSAAPTPVLRPELLASMAAPGSDAEFAIEVVIGLRDDEDHDRLLKGVGQLADAVRAELHWAPGEFWAHFEAILKDQSWSREVFRGQAWGPHDLDRLAPWWTILAAHRFPESLDSARAMLDKLRRGKASWKAASGRAPNHALLPLVTHLRQLLDDYTGLAVVRTGDELADDELRCLVLMIGSHFGPNVSPGVARRPLFAIEPSEPTPDYVGNGHNSQGIAFHSDGSGTGLPVEILGLACIRRALAGGHTRVSNAIAAYCSLPPRLQRHLTREFPREDPYQPGLDAADLVRAPIFAIDAHGVRFSYHPQRVRNGIRTCNPVSEVTKEDKVALDALDAALDAHGYDILLERGDVLFVKNTSVAHGRRAFDASAGRQLERYWGGSA